MKATRAVVLASALTTMGIAPPFLVGGLAVQIGAQLRMSPATLGLAISLFFGATSLSSLSLGKAVQRWGVRRGLASTAMVTGIGLVGIAASPSLPVLGLSLAVAGVANGAVHPAANALLANGVRGRLGLAMGIKQAAMPLSTMAAGLAVPAIALTVGWRWAFVGTAMLSGLLVRSALRIDDALLGAPAEPQGSGSALRGQTMLLLAIGAGFGSAAGNSIGTFLVDSGVAMVGLSEARAGLVSALAGSAGFAGRVFFGWLVDWSPRMNPYIISVTLLVIGCAGQLMISGQTPVLFTIGALLAFGAGWAWPGLVHFELVNRYRSEAARTTGTVMTGFAGGSFLGPLVLGQIAQAFGYPMLWVTMALFAMIAAAVIFMANRRFARVGVER